MTDVKADFVKNLYIEIDADEDGHCLVKDRVSNQVYVKKTLDIYSIAVYEYLRTHRSVHIPAVETYWEEDGKLVVIEELISGRTLEYILQNIILSEKQKVSIMDQICDGVTTLHQAVPKIIHRDLKASNIMVSNDNIVKIIDYDAAKIYNPAEKKDTVLIGTQGSAAPEQYGFRPSDERTDIYALGILMKEMFPNNPRMRQIAEKASSFSPEDRYASVQELKTQMEKKVNRSSLLHNIPGLRSEKIYVKLFSSLGYITLLLAVAHNTNFKQSSSVVTGIGFLMLFLNWIDLYGHWTGLFEDAPLIHHANRAVRILGYILMTVVIFFVWAMVIGMLQSFLK